MLRIIAGLLVIGSLGCNVGDREVPASRPSTPGVGVDGSVDGRSEADTGSKVMPPPAKGDTTTCVFMNGTGKEQCMVATSYPGPLAFQCAGVGSCSVEVTAPKGTELTWKSTCGSYAYSVVDGQPDTIGFVCGPGAQGNIEMVTCTFAGSAKQEACTTTGLPGPFRCSGIGSCQVAVLTASGTQLTWTSTCGGQHQTVTGSGGGTLPFTCN